MKIKGNKEIKFTDSNKTKKIGFFERIKRSIFNVEKYGEFLLEKTSVSIKYFFLLIIIISIILSGVSTYNFAKIIDKAYSYITNELPDFTYENGKVNFASKVEGHDKDLDLYNIIDSNINLTEEDIKEYKDKVKDYELAIILLNEKIIILQSGQFSEVSYLEIEKNYNAEISNRAELIKTIDTLGVQGIDITYFVASIISLYIVNLLTFLGDILMVCIFGYLVSKIAGVPLTIMKTFVLSVYSLTLSIILNTIYSAVFSLTGFVIEYFDIMYLLVAYIYIIASILIIKSDLIKQQAELQKIYKVEEEVKKELDEQKEKEEEEKREQEKKKKEKKKEKDEEEDEPIINREPDGSEI